MLLSPFFDGGATVTAIAGAAAARLGYKQKRKDDKELASKEELVALKSGLREARESVYAGHQACTKAWRSPLSLFEPSAADGAPGWAVDCVCIAQRLVEEASIITDLADVYETQLALISATLDRDGRSHRGLRWAPVQLLIVKLNRLAERLALHLPSLITARFAFDDAMQTPPPLESKIMLPDEAVTKAMTVARDDYYDLQAEGSEELPVAILKDRGFFGELWRLQEDALHRILRQRHGDEEVGILKEDLSMDDFATADVLFWS